MNELTTYKGNQFGKVRTWVDENGVMWYCGKDICDYLEYGNITEAMRKHVNKADMIKHATEFTKREDGTKRLVVTMLYINKGGLWSLVLNSKMPKAKEFYRAVTHEVLPTIEETGMYVSSNFDPSRMPVEQRNAFWMEFARQFIAKEEERQRLAAQNVRLLDENTILGERVEAQEVQIAQMEEAHQQEIEAVRQESAEQAAYVADVLSSNNALRTTQIAKDYGMSAKAFNKLLSDLHIQYKSCGQWLLYAEYADKGYTKSHTYDGEKPTGGMWTNEQTHWTQKGREWLYTMLKKVGILPIVERHN